MRRIAFLFALVPTFASAQSYFDCKEQSGGTYRPYYMKAVQQSDEYVDFSKKPKGLLGQKPMKSLDECRQAASHAQNEYGVICSRTGLDGWKPTLYTGGAPGRSDYGYMGGSSIMNFSNCLTATLHASDKGVCYWGGSEWYISRIDKASTIGGPFRSLDACISKTQ